MCTQVINVLVLLKQTSMMQTLKENYIRKQGFRQQAMHIVDVVYAMPFIC